MEGLAEALAGAEQEALNLLRQLEELTGRRPVTWDEPHLRHFAERAADAAQQLPVRLAPMAQLGSPGQKGLWGQLGREHRAARSGLTQAAASLAQLSRKAARQGGSATLTPRQAADLLRFVARAAVSLGNARRILQEFDALLNQ